MKAFSADQKNQAKDALSFMLSKKVFDTWEKSDRNSPLLQLIKGSRLMVNAWEARGYGYADTVGQQSADSFYNLLTRAKSTLLQVQGPLKAEANNLLIRVNKGLSDPELSRQAFDSCITLEKEHAMAYLNYLDLILPKWHGSEEEASAFVEAHKGKSFLIGMLLKTKWLFEQTSYGDTDVSQEIEDFFSRHEQEIAQFKSKSPHRFVLYNYMMLLAEEVGNKKLSKRYTKKLKEYLSASLYSPLRSEKEIKEKLYS